MEGLRRRRVAGSIILAAVLVGCAGQELSPSGTSVEPTPTPSDAEPTASASPEPTATPVPVELTWTSEGFMGQVAAITNDNGTLVAVGRDREGLASWTSGDGARWERHAVPDPTFIADMVDDFGPSLYGGTQMGPLTRLGDTLFSFGTFLGPIDFYRPVAWRSADGSSWEFVESESEFYQFGAITDAETFGDGLLASRATGLIGPSNDLWHWDADARWQKSTIQSAVGASLVILDAAVAENDALVVGQRAEHDTFNDLGANEAVAWYSSDGVIWDELGLPQGMASACGVDATPSGGYAVMGTRGNGDVAVWTTPDGSNWSRSDLGSGSCGDDAVTLAGAWIVATTASGDEGAQIWISHDGSEWIAQDTPPIRSALVAELNGEIHILGTPIDDTPFRFTLLHGHP